MKVYALSDVGRSRKNNEDSYFTYRNDKLFGGMVADGMGGHNSGEVASRMAADIIKQYIISEYTPNMDYMKMAELIKEAFRMANRDIYNASKKEENNGMGTTATLAVVYEGKLIVAHIGDSRCYKIDDKGIKQITNDHSFVGELVRSGHITEDAAKIHPNRNLITRALGVDITLKIDMDISSYNGETVVLCTDGLTNMISDSQIEDSIRYSEDLDEALQNMVSLANKKGGSDNITVIAFTSKKGEAEK